MIGRIKSAFRGFTRMDSSFDGGFSVGGRSNIPNPYTGGRWLPPENVLNNPVTMACINEIVTASSDAPLRAYMRDGNVFKPVSDVLARKLKAPNKMQGGSELVADILQSLETYGNAYVEKLRKNGLFDGLYCHSGDNVEIKTDNRTGRPSLYEVGSKRRKIKLDDMIHLKYPNPFDSVYGLSPVSTAMLWITMDNNAAGQLSDGMLNGIPRGIIQLENTKLTDEQSELLAWKFDQIYGGGTVPPPTGWTPEQVEAAEERLESRRNGIMFSEFSEGKLSYIKMGMSPDEFDAPGTFNRAESRICMPHGVSPIMIQSAVGMDKSTYSNYQEARKSFWREKMRPTLRYVGESLNRSIAPEFGRESWPNAIGFDMTAVDELREDLTGERRLALDSYKAGGITRDELRTVLSGLADVDLEPLGGEDGGFISDGSGSSDPVEVRTVD